MSSYIELFQMTGLLSPEFNFYQDGFEDDISCEPDSLQSESMFSEYEAAAEAPQVLAAFQLSQLGYE